MVHAEVGIYLVHRSVVCDADVAEGAFHDVERGHPDLDLDVFHGSDLMDAIERTVTTMQQIDCTFASQGSTCAATLMLPDGSNRPPVVVMAHGFANIRMARLPAFAERFVEAGYAALLFDYRTFGDSEGEPRNWVHPGRQLEDWHAAISFARGRDDVDGGRVIAWGTSFSGGLVLKVGAKDHSLAAVISQIPHTSGLATVLKAPMMTTLKSTAAAVYDTALGLVGREYYSPVVGQPGELAALVADQAPEAYHRLLPEGSGWENRLLSRSMLQVPLFTPRNSATRISAPVLMVVAARDNVVSASAAVRTARKIPDCTVRVLDADHFQPYTGDSFEENIAHQIAFLRERVPVD